MLGKADDLGSSYNPDAALANAVLEAYAYDPEGLTMEEYADLGLNVDQAYALSRVLTAGKDFKPGDGIITPEAHDSFLSAGLSETFIANLGGTDGRRALQERVKWLSDNVFTQWLRNDYEYEERGNFFTELSEAFSDPNRTADLAIKVLSEEDDAAMRSIVVWNLGEMGKEGLHSDRINLALAQSLDDEDELVRIEAVHALGKHGASAMSTLIDALDHPDLQNEALETLKDLGSEAAPAVPELIKTLASSDQYCNRADAAEALGNIGDEASAAMPLLIEGLDDEDDYVRSESMKAILKIAQADPNDYEKLFNGHTLDVIGTNLFAAGDGSFADDASYFAEAAIEAIENRQCLSLSAFLGSDPVQYLHHHAG